MNAMLTPLIQIVKMEKQIMAKCIACIVAAFTLMASSAVYAVTYDPATNQLTIPTITVSNTTYSNIVVTVGTVISSNTGVAPATDVYDVATNQLTIPSIMVGGVIYTNVVITVGQVLSVGSSTTAGVCPVAAQSDVWANVRLGCLQPGQNVISISANATGTPMDTAYIINEAAYDNSFTNINNGKNRYFQYFLCVRNAPSNISRLSLGTDLTVAIGLGNFGRALPSGIATAAFTISGGDRPGFVAVTCDPAIHPVIVDYATGKVESVNAEALANLTIYDR